MPFCGNDEVLDKPHRPRSEGHSCVTTRAYQPIRWWIQAETSSGTQLADWIIGRPDRCRPQGAGRSAMGDYEPERRGFGRSQTLTRACTPATAAPSPRRVVLASLLERRRRIDELSCCRRRCSVRAEGGHLDGTDEWSVPTPAELGDVLLGGEVHGHGVLRPIASQRFRGSFVASQFPQAGARPELLDLLEDPLEFRVAGGSHGEVGGPQLGALRWSRLDGPAGQALGPAARTLATRSPVAGVPDA